MARRFVLVVAALALMVGMGASTVGVATVAAQTVRTAPPAVDLTCHGYDEGATRAYNCIPEPSQQHYMRTFVPPVGSACDAGSIAEFPAGRIVFQIRCRDGSRGQTAAWSHWGRGPASFDMPEDASARLWVHTAFSGSSVHFVVRCLAPQQRVVVNELLGRSWGNTGTNGIYGMAGCREVEVDTGGQDLQWWFTQELAATASMPPRSWEQVTGAGGALPAQALQDLAGAVDLERLGGPPSQWGIQPLLDANDRADLRTSDAEGISLSGVVASRPPDDRTYALDGASVRGATTRTVPLTLDLTCHGYVEAAGTRAYNCIPVPSQQHHMRTFVPPVGSACDAGSIAEFPPGRIVFQIRCRDGDATPPPPPPPSVPEGTYTGDHSRGGSVRIEISGSTVTTIELRDIDVTAGTCTGHLTYTRATNLPISNGTFSRSGTSSISGATVHVTIRGRVVNADSIEGSADYRITGVCTASVSLTFTARRGSSPPPSGNRAPEAVGAIPAQTLTAGGSARNVNAAGYFRDPDGDALSYTARSSRSSVVAVTVSGSTVTLTPSSQGSATVTVTARDPEGLTATQHISVTVESGGGGGGGSSACRVGQVYSPGESCTHRGTTFSVLGGGCFSLSVAGTGRFCGVRHFNIFGWSITGVGGSNFRIDGLP